MALPAEQRRAAVLVEARGLIARRGRRTVLQDVDLRLGAAEILAVEGANGAGKSTLLRVLAGVAAPAAGVLERAGGDDVVFVPERPSLAEAVRARDLLARLRALRGLPAEDWSARAAAAGLLEDALDRPVGRLSKGQAQRVVLIEALAAGAPLLVLDEPWEALDPDGRDWLAAELRAAAARGAGVVFTDHSGTGRARLAVDGVVRVEGGQARRVAASAPPAGPALVRIQAVASGGAPVEHTVAAGEVDDLLRRLLAEGASIVTVGPP